MKKKAKPRVVIELWQRGAELKGKVLEMDEKLRGTGLLERAGAVELWSLSRPEIGRLCVATRALYLRGDNRSADKRLMRQTFDSEKAASDFVLDIRACLDKLNGVTLKPKPAPKRWTRVI